MTSAALLCGVECNMKKLRLCNTAFSANTVSALEKGRRGRREGQWENATFHSAGSDHHDGYIRRRFEHFQH